MDVPNALNHLLLSLRLFSQVFLSAFLCQAGVFLSAFRPLSGFIKAKKAPYKDANLVYPYKMDGDVLPAHTGAAALRLRKYPRTVLKTSAIEENI